MCLSFCVCVCVSVCVCVCVCEHEHNYPVVNELVVAQGELSCGESHVHAVTTNNFNNPLLQCHLHCLVEALNEACVTMMI